MSYWTGYGRGLKFVENVQKSSESRQEGLNDLKTIDFGVPTNIQTYKLTKRPYFGKHFDRPAKPV